MDVKDILKDLVKFNTIKDKENKKIINYIENYLKGIGFYTEYKSKCLVMTNKENCNIGFLGHTDTISYTNDWIQDPFNLKEIDKKIYGLGTCDMKGSIAAILSAVNHIDFSKNKKGIKLFFTYDEEIGFSGINELIEKTKFPKYMIIGEPTNNKRLNASKGLLEIKISFLGISSHSSNPDDGINAIETCIEFINYIKKYYKKLKQETINNKTITMNIGMINGGERINVVPNRCDLLVDFRTISKKQNEKIIKAINKYIKGNNMTYEIINNINPFLNNLEEIKMSDFITEASFICSDNKYILGPGPINAHKRDEFITTDSLYKLEKQYIEIIKENINKE